MELKLQTAYVRRCETELPASVVLEMRDDGKGTVTIEFDSGKSHVTYEFTED